MERCDVLIVGGGPAGSTCARALRRAGVDALVMDRKQFPRDKTCAGWITPAVVRVLELEVAEYSAGRTFQPISRFLTGEIGAAMVESDCARTVSYGILRREFDDYLLRRSGARLLLGRPLETLERLADGWLVNGTLHARMLVGAGGHFCPVARLTGASASAPRTSETVVAAQEAEFEMNDREWAACGVEANRPELYFCQDLRGYGWAFRKGNYLNVGLGREDPHALATHVEQFRDWLAREGRIPSGVTGKFHGHAYLLYPHSPRELFDDGLLLVGDAAGLAQARSGEGILPAVESGLLAARVIVAARGDYRRAGLAAYAAQLGARFGRRLAPGASPPAPAGRLAQRAARWLLRRRWFARHVVVDRWFLRSELPPLAS